MSDLEDSEEMVTLIEGSGIVNPDSFFFFFYGKLEETIHSCDEINKICGGCFYSACKKQYFFIKKGENLHTSYEEKTLDKYGSIVRNHEKKSELNFA